MFGGLEGQASRGLVLAGRGAEHLTDNPDRHFPVASQPPAPRNPSGTIPCYLKTVLGPAGAEPILLDSLSLRLGPRDPKVRAQMFEPL